MLAAIDVALRCTASWTDLRISGSRVHRQIYQCPHSQLHPAFINRRLWRVVSGRVFLFHVQRFATNKDIESGYLFLEIGEILGVCPGSGDTQFALTCGAA